MTVINECRSPVALAAAYAHPIEFIVGKTFWFGNGDPLLTVVRRYYPVDATPNLAAVSFAIILDLDYFWQHFNPDPSLRLPFSMDVRACHRTAWFPRLPPRELRRQLRCARILRLALRNKRFLGPTQTVVEEGTSGENTATVWTRLIMR